MPAAAFLALGERLTRALVTGDLGLYVSVFRLPLRVEPRNNDAYDIADAAALAQDFDHYRIAVSVNGVTDIHRRILRIDDLGDNRLLILAEMNILRRAERVVAPFNARFTLDGTGGDWRICGIQSALGHARWATGDAPPDRRDLD